MPKYYFYQVSAKFVGPNSDVPQDCAGAYVHCVVDAPDRAAAAETLASDLKNIGFVYETVDELMDLDEAVERFDMDPNHEDMDSPESVIYGDFHCYPHAPEPQQSAGD